MTHHDERVDGMFRRDCVAAFGAIAAVWALYAFIYYTLHEIFGELGLNPLMSGLALTILLLNLAAVIAMIRHYSEDRTAIYSRDLYYLDMLRAQRTEGR